MFKPKKMPADSMPGFWKQRKQAFLDVSRSRNITLLNDVPTYLKQVQKPNVSSEDYYYVFSGNRERSIEANNYSFEEAFWFAPDLLEFVEYTIDPESGKATIQTPQPLNPPKSGAQEIKFVFEKVLLNLVPEHGTVLTPTTEHPCTHDDNDPDAAAMTAGSNCPIPLVMADDHFLLFYLKDEEKVYRTDISPEYELKFNNFLIPTLSADMSIWWYKIPNPDITSDASAQLIAEEVLTIWHKDRENYLSSLVRFPHLTPTHYVGVYQRSYFCDELQMRFTNVARIGNDHTLPLDYNVQELNRVTYEPLNVDLMG